MKKTISIKLQPTAEQYEQLVKVQVEFSHACTLVVPYAINNRCWNRVALHHLAYYPVQEQTALGSQMLCNAIKSVADAYKVIKPKKTQPVPEIVFKPTGSVHYDKRTYSFKGDRLSLWTLQGRCIVAMQPGAFQSDYRAEGSAKEAELCRRGKTFYFNLVLDLPDVPANGSGVMGVDVGENNLAATSTGKLVGGGKLN